MKQSFGRAATRGRSAFWACCAGAALTVVGCDQMPARVAPIHPVKGKVILPSSSAATGLKIMFLPDGGNGKTATGEIKPDGGFELTTDAPGDGIAEGKYKVQFQWTPANVKPQKGGQLPAPPISSAYLDADDSGFKAEITASTTEVGPFDVKTVKTGAKKEAMRD